MSEALETDWVIVKVRPGAEEVAERNLRQEGYRAYLPRYRKMLRPRGEARKGQPSMRPAFPGYLFVQDWRGWPERPITGVIGLMMRAGGGNRPRYMSGEDVDLIHKREMEGAFDDERSPIHNRARRRDLSVGDTVEYEWHGERVLAVLAGLTDAGKAILRDILFAGKPVLIPRLTVDADELEKVEV